jgi:hypothetical protein
MTQYNLGSAYRTLAEVKDKAVNIQLAKEAYQKVLQIFNKEDCPEVYSLVMGNVRKLEEI